MELCIHRNRHVHTHTYNNSRRNNKVHIYAEKVKLVGHTYACVRLGRSVEERDG